MVEPGALVDLIGRWWWNYDEGNFDVLAGLLTEDMHFSCRTDTGTTDWEEFVRADVHGRDTVMHWQRDHRVNSPYPLRHNGTNVHVVARDGNEASFTSYILVTHIVGGQVTTLPGGVVNGRVRIEGQDLRICALEVVLDTMESALFSEVKKK